MSVEKITVVLARRLPSLSPTAHERLAQAYVDGALAHAIERTTGTGSVPTHLAGERAELVAFICRSLGRLLTAEEIAALLRIVSTAAQSVRKTMLAVFDDLPLLAFKAAFLGARRDGRGSEGEISNGYRVNFASNEKMEIARDELARQGYQWELIESSGTRHLLLIDSGFPIVDILPE